MTVRKLAQLAQISHTQVGRIESGDVATPSRHVLVAIAEALDRNPQPLFVLAGHLSIEDARDELAPMFREGSELAEVWGDWASFGIGEAREVLRQPRPDGQAIRYLAADVFTVPESDETSWRPEDSLYAFAGATQQDLRDLLSAWRFIGSDRRGQLLEYARALRRLEDLEYLTAIERLHVESDAVAGGETDGHDTPFSEDDLRAQGFEGFVRVAALPSGARNVPATPGVYTVVRRSNKPPTFLTASVGGHFKGRDPSVSGDILRTKWVDGTSVLYVGSTAKLRDRLNLLARFGRGEPVGHWGGRYLWQIADHDQLLVAWLETSDQIAREAALIEDFHSAFAALPFANIARPRGEVQS
jgi:transcriptional regulator with XRE-family HTH domain